MIHRLRRLLALPRGRQLDAVQELCEELGAGAREDWNTQFGAGSLFEAWTASNMVLGVYEANRRMLPSSGRVVEIGGGDGRLWRDAGFTGEVVLFDPAPEAHERVGDYVSLVSRVEPVGTDIPPCDLVISSLTLHHVAGRSSAERARWGLSGPGKVEILRAMAQAAPRIVLNDADVHCELDLAPGDPVLADNLIDSYVRRCAHCLLDQLEAEPDSPYAARWRHIIHRWCLDQVALYKAPRTERDVYELDVRRWEECFDAAGLRVESRRCTDDYGLFYQYVLAPVAGSR